MPVAVSAKRQGRAPGCKPRYCAASTSTGLQAPSSGRKPVHRSPGRNREADSWGAGPIARRQAPSTGPASGRRTASAHATTSACAGRQPPAPDRKPTHPHSRPAPTTRRLPHRKAPGTQAPKPLNQRRHRTPHASTRPRTHTPPKQASANHPTPPRTANPQARKPPSPSTSAGTGHHTPPPGRKTTHPHSRPAPTTRRLPHRKAPGAQAPMPINQRRRRTPHVCTKPQTQATGRKPVRHAVAGSERLARPQAQVPAVAARGAQVPSGGGEPGRRTRRRTASPRISADVGCWAREEDGHPSAGPSTADRRDSRPLSRPRAVPPVWRSRPRGRRRVVR